MKIGIEVSEVLFDFEFFQLSPKVIHYFEKKYQLTVKNENGNRLYDIYGCSEQTEKKLLKALMTFVTFMKPRWNMLEVLSQLRTEGNKIILFAPDLNSHSAWNYRNQINRICLKMGLQWHHMDVDKIVFYSLEDQLEDKKRICQKESIQVMVQSNIDQLRYLSNITKVLYMRTNENQELIDNPKNIISSANDLYRRIGQIQRKKSEFSILTRKEKQELDTLQKEIYFERLKEHYQNLPFDQQNLTKSAAYYQILSRIVSQYFQFKYKPFILCRNHQFDNGTIFVSNHLCANDLLLIMSALKKSPWHPLAKQELLYDKVKYLFEAVYSVYVNRQSPISCHNATEALAQILAHRGNILIFPEGTYNRQLDSCNLLPFKGKSAVYLSQVMKCPIRPIAITGVYEKDISPVVQIGDPIYVTNHTDLDQANEQLWHQMNCMIDHNHQLLKLQRQNLRRRHLCL